MPVYCDKCLGYVTDKLSFPPHAHEPVMQVLKFKNLVKYAHVLAHFILEWITLCEHTEVVHIVYVPYHLLVLLLVSAQAIYAHV